MTALLIWNDAEVSLPDDETTVLVALADGDVWMGFRDGDDWRDVSAELIEEEVVEPMAAEMLQGWPEMIECVSRVLGGVAYEPPPPPVKLTAYAESLLRAKDVSDKINRRVGRAGK